MTLNQLHPTKSEQSKNKTIVSNCEQRNRANTPKAKDSSCYGDHEHYINHPSSPFPRFLPILIAHHTSIQQASPHSPNDPLTSPVPIQPSPALPQQTIKKKT